jgi:hypothetical protein
MTIVERVEPRPLNVRRSVCGPDCGGWLPREPKPDEPLSCDAWHPRKRLYCEADARFAITSRFLIRLARRQRQPKPRPFYRCASCARRYQSDPDFIVERLMAPPPKQVQA